MTESSSGVLRPIVSREGRLFWLRKLHSSGGQYVVSIPRELMERANLRRGAMMLMWYDDGEVKMRTLDEEFLKSVLEGK